MRIKQKSNDTIIMLFYKSIDSSKITGKFGYGLRWSNIESFKFLQKRIYLLKIWFVMIDKSLFLRCRDYLATKAVIKLSRNICKYKVIEFR